MIRTKICGISSHKDLEIAINSGTDAVGFLIGQKHNAIGFISPGLASEMRDLATPFVNTVVVTHIEDPKEVVKIAEIVRPTTIQLHSDMRGQDIYSLRSLLPFVKLICKVSVTGPESIDRASELEEYADAILLDTIDLVNDKVGGTGIVHDWSISKRIVENVSKPVILAGGLNPENVRQAITLVKPSAVDVNSGVSVLGKKDIKLVNAFVGEAKKLVF